MVDPRTISSREFHENLCELARTRDAGEHGFFGPGSLTWRVSREAVLFATGARTLLLQVAHPKIAQGVADHSRFREDGLGRGVRTFDAVFRIVFGNTETAIRAATRVHAIHARVTGTVRDPLPAGTDPAYAANDPQLLLWVYATLVDSALWGYEMFLGPLAEHERDVWYEEGKVFAALFGIDDTVVPRDYAAFAAYMRDMLNGDALTVTPTGRAVADALVRGGPALLRPAGPFNRVLAAGMLTPRLRGDFGLAWNPAISLAYQGILAATRATAQALPAALRAHPAALRAERRARPRRRPA